MASHLTKKSLKSRLREGEKLYGLFLFTLSPEIAEIAALGGYDFIIIDMEHGPGGIREALHCIRAIEAAGCSTVIRVPEISHAWALKALDLGPNGIMFPMVETGKSASEAVSYCRYRPYGLRGCAFGSVRDSKYGFNESYLSNFDENLFILAQIESEEGVRNVNEIVAVDGVDCVIIGPKDLSASLGLLRDPSNVKVKSALRTAETAVLSSDPANGGAYLAGITSGQDSSVELSKRGCHLVVGSGDVRLFKKAVVDDVKGFKKYLEG